MLSLTPRDTKVASSTRWLRSFHSDSPQIAPSKRWVILRVMIRMAFDTKGHGEERKGAGGVLLHGKKREEKERKERKGDARRKGVGSLFAHNGSQKTPDPFSRLFTRGGSARAGYCRPSGARAM